MATTYRYISADSHLEIPAERWRDYIPAEYRDRAPRLVRLPNGADAWLAEGRPLHINGLNLAAGKPRETISPIGGQYEASAGTGPPEQRLAEQDRDGIDAEVLFTGVAGPGLWRGIREDRVYKAVVRAYNDFLGREYCAVAPSRLIGLGVLPETGVEDAIAEMAHCKELGLGGVTLNAFPHGKSHPVPEDDRFWAAAVEMGMPVTVHVEFGFPANNYGGRAGPSFAYPQMPEEGMAGPMDVIPRFAKYGFRAAFHAVQMVWAGVFDRHPDLRIFFAETQIGWLPNFLEQMDSTYERSRHWVHRHLGLEPLHRKPSEYVLEHCYWGFQYNPLGVRTVVREMGPDRVMWANDFPHLESDWPNSMAVIEESFMGVDDDARHRMVAGNAMEFFRLGG